MADDETGFEDANSIDETTFTNGIEAAATLGVIAIQEVGCPRCGIEPDEIHPGYLNPIWLEPCDHEIQPWAALEILVFRNYKDEYPELWNEIRSEWPGLRD